MTILADDLESACACAWTVLCNAQDADDAGLLLGILFPDEEVRSILESVRAGRPWTLGRVKEAVLNHARQVQAFSANWFYTTLPESAWPFIGPAIHSLRHRHFDNVGTEIAINPPRKMSRVTVYQLRDPEGTTVL